MNEINYKTEGVVFDIQRFSIHDGPGIRTIVFLKGCPLSCRWCCNPESQNPHPVLMYQQSSCLHCGKCINVCEVGAISVDNPRFVDRDRCVACGKCADVCPAGALTMKGRKMTVWEVMQVLQKDATTYRRSGGGITLSGGEPLMQSGFAVELLKACHEKGWHTAMETTGFAPKESVERVMPWLDLVLMDIKSPFTEVHEKNTGVPNAKILENAVRISNITKTVVRVPTIPGVNADPESIAEIAKIAKTMHNVDTIHILPYHTYGENKYDLLGTDYPMGDTPPLPLEEAEKLKNVVEAAGLQCVIGG